MSSHFDAVDPDHSIIVYCLKMQENALAYPLLRNSDRATIPDGQHKICMLNARKWSFWTERDKNTIFQCAVQQTAFQATVAMIDFKLPFTIEAQPLGTDKLWTWIFWSRYIHNLLLSGKGYSHSESANIIY